MLQLITYRVAICLLAFAFLTAAAATPELQSQVAEASELYERERAEEFLEALESGEDSEHIFLLQERIDSGAFDLDALFNIGDAFFEHAFRSLDGYGDSARPQQQRIHSGLRGGLDTFSCAGCHSVGGPNGAGSFTQNAFLEGDGKSFLSANVRNPPALQGVGLIQALAAEMSRELKEQRAAAVRRAREEGESTRVRLNSKGVSFGALSASPEGELDLSELNGVDSDLVVRPFGWKGHQSSLRRFIEDAARIHFGIQSHPQAILHRETPQPALLGSGKNWFDPDGDGEQRELEEGTLTAAAVYLAMLESPVIQPPRDAKLLDRWAQGSESFRDIGCESCHRRTLKLYRNEWQEKPDTTKGSPVTVRLLRDGDGPKSLADVELFSDLKRHDMGAALSDAHADRSGLPRDRFLTRPLWGLAESGPYLHDGSANTIPEAILRHGGEAKESRDRFDALPAEGQANVHLFLLSLTRKPKPRLALGTAAGVDASEAVGQSASQGSPAPLQRQAEAALRKDRLRRELRFVDAVDPGSLFRTTRVPQSEINEGSRTPAELFAIGSRLFDLSFTRDQGFGARDLPPVSRVHRGARGAAVADRCSRCHHVGGPAGAGDAASNAYLDGDGTSPQSAFNRNPVALQGAGWLELAATEMTRELQATRERLKQEAKASGESVRDKLSAKGVDFGFLTAHADQTTESSEVTGVDKDLVVRAFGWKGRFAHLRDVIENELLIHHGMQSADLAQQDDPGRVGPYDRPDPDGDGVVGEISEGQVTALTAYLALQEVPQLDPPAEGLVPVSLWAKGRKSFETIGCADCHRISLPVESDTYQLPSRSNGPTLTWNLAAVGQSPRLAPSPADEDFTLFLFSDLKRHDMGEELAESRADRGVGSAMFLTPPLWGLARSGPWLHDGRAPTIEDAILMHGGEAQASRDRYAAMSDVDRGLLRIYLTSLNRAARMVVP